MSIADHMRHFRAQRGFSQRRLASEMGRDVTQINGWECGRTVPSEESLGRIAAALGVSVEDLRKGPDAAALAPSAEIGSGPGLASVEELLAALARQLGIPASRLKVTIEILP